MPGASTEENAYNHNTHNRSQNGSTIKFYVEWTLMHHGRVLTIPPPCTRTQNQYALKSLAGAREVRNLAAYGGKSYLN